MWGGAKFTSPLKVIIDPAVHAVQYFIVEFMSLSGLSAGVTMFILSLVIMIIALIWLVKNMRVLIINKTEVFIHKYLFRNDLTAMVLGMCLTVSVQSSSITTSLIIPLVGAGIVTLNRCYPFTLGANVGTTCTALLASLATVSVVNGRVCTIGVTAAFAHLLFNMCGIAVFYPLKKLPIACARWLADIAAESKKWAFIFVLGVFFILPLVIIFITR